MIQREMESVILHGEAIDSIKEEFEKLVDDEGYLPKQVLIVTRPDFTEKKFLSDPTLLRRKLFYVVISL